MRKSIWVALLLIASTVQGFAARTPAVPRVNNVVVERISKDWVQCRFDLRVDGLKSNTRCVVTPVLGKLILPGVVVSGKTRLLIDQRNGIAYRDIVYWIDQELCASGLVQAVVDKYGDLIGKPGQVLKYSVQVMDRGTLDGVNLRVETKFDHCFNRISLPSSYLVHNQLVQNILQPRYDKQHLEAKLKANGKEIEQLAPFLRNSATYQLGGDGIDALREQGGLAVYFKRERAEIDFSHQDNEQTIAQFKRVVELIRSDDTAELDRLVIFGSASPEGNVAFNTRLAEQRMNAVKEYCMDLVGPIEFDLINVGEDWQGLAQLVAESGMPHKEEVLEVINNYSVDQGRKERIKQINNGAIYDYMLEYLYPKLRSAAYIQLFYELQLDSDAKLLNEAIDRTNKQHYKEALALISKIKKPTARSYNLEGVCRMMLVQEKQAKACFEKAVALGDSDAQYNLGQLPSYIQ